MGLISNRPIKVLQKNSMQPKKETRPKNNIIQTIQKIKINFDEYLIQFKDDYKIIYKREDLEEFINKSTDIVAVDTETTGLDMDCKLVGICAYTLGQKAIYIPTYHVDCIMNEDIKEVACYEDIHWFMTELNKKQLIYHNAAFDIRILKMKTGVDMNYPYWDTLVAAHLTNFDRNKRGLKYQYNKYVAKDDNAMGNYAELFEGLTLEKLPINLVYIYAARDAFMTYKLYEYQKKLFNNDYQEQRQVFDLELKLTKIISEMKIEGIYFDKEYASKMSDDLHRELEHTKQELYDVVSKNVSITYDMNKFDPNSPIKLKELLFRYMKIPIPKGETYKSISVDEATLSSLNHPVCTKLLEYRKIFKQLNTYIDKMFNAVGSDGNVHCDFNSHGAITGRFSCISKGTSISTTFGYINIEDIQPWDCVYGYDTDNNLRLCPIVRKIYNGVKDCVEYTFTNPETGVHTKLVCTPDHTIKTKLGWKQAQHLDANDEIYYLYYDKNKLKSTTHAEFSPMRNNLGNEILPKVEVYSYYKLHSKKEVGKHVVYDLEVETTHNFIANDICVHNCSNPNLQNISNEFKSHTGAKYNIRGMFRPKDGEVWIGADYSGQEVRVAAAISKDKNLYHAFETGQDIHSFMASLAFKVPYDECLEFRQNDDPDGKWKKGDTNKEGKARRKKAKAITFGLAYGTSVQGLAETIGCSKDEAQEVMDAYFEAFPTIQNAINDAQEYGKKYGYVKTLLNRIRPIDHILAGAYTIELVEDSQFNFDPDLNSNDGLEEVPKNIQDEIIRRYDVLKSYRDKKDFESMLLQKNIKIKNNSNDYNSALRQCFNSWVQGSSAEQTKLALVKIYEDERLRKLGARIILSIHDENVITVPIEHQEEAAKYLQEDMLEAANEIVDIVFKSDLEFYKRWF